jgi:DNA modification methylase
VANLGDLNPNERNPRRISEAQLSALKKSLAEFGPLDGFVFNRKTKRLVGGHQRQKSLPQNCPIKIIEKILKPNSQGTIARGFVEMENGERITYREVSWNEGKEKAAMIAANKHSGEWENEILAGILSELNESDRELTGFELDEIQELLERLPNENAEADAEPQIDKAKELAAKWKTARGQIWELGNHKLMCGDSTNAREVGALMLSEKAQLVFTDPPYGVGYDGGTATPRKLLDGDESESLYDPCCEMSAQFSDEKCALYFWHGHTKAAAAAAAAAGWTIRSLLIWNKNQAQFGALSAQYKQKHEPCLYCFKTGKTARWFGPTNEVTVWDIDRASKNEFHPTQKPTELAARAITNSSSRNDIVADWFLGSGATLIACEQLGRKCRAMEIDPGYVAVAIQRWADATGKKPKLL